MSISPALPAAVQAELAKGQKESQAVILWTVGMFCIFGWDYFMNLPSEIERVWKKKFTHISAFYIANRYFGLLKFALMMPLITAPITGAISAQTCQKMYLFLPVSAVISTFLSQFILASRVFAMYGKSTLIAVLLGSIVVIETGIQAYSVIYTFPAPSPAPGIVIPCVPGGPTGWLLTWPALPLFFDTITFFLTLYKSWKYWRTQVRSHFVALFFRDGLIYFAATLSMNLISVILMVTQDGTLRAVNIPATLMLTIIMSCRLVLNIRAPRSVITSDAHPLDPVIASRQKRNTLETQVDSSHYSDSCADHSYGVAKLATESKEIC